MRCESGIYIYILISVCVFLYLTVEPYFIYSTSPNYYYKVTALRHQDKFINCSVELHNLSFSILWKHKNELLPTNYDSNGHQNNTESIKYSQNRSGLTIHNVTEDDQGSYCCLVGNTNPLNATISLHVVCKISIICMACVANMYACVYYYLCHFPYIYTFIKSVLPLVQVCVFSLLGPPELLFEHNQTVIVNVNEQVVLNCTVSSSPDSVYNWSIPDTCSFCPHTNNDSVMIFTADITDRGEYVCEANNEYGSIQRRFTVNVICKWQ